MRPCVRASVFDFPGRFARDIPQIPKIGGTPHADRRSPRSPFGRRAGLEGDASGELPLGRGAGVALDDNDDDDDDDNEHSNKSYWTNAGTTE